MAQINQNYCLILAGGVGSRLWPMSTVECPKQFQDIFGTGRTLIQQTYDRFLRFIQPDHIYVSTCQDYLDIVREQLPDIPDCQIIKEPLRRGTLASVAVGSLIIAAQRDAQANVVCSPADQWITDESAFQTDVLNGLEFVAHSDGLLTMGLCPTRPDTEYGYIQVGDQVKPGFSKVKSFTEKPQRDFAEMFMQSGEFLWNVGLFMFNVQVMLRQLTKQVPAYEVELPRMMSELANSTKREVPEFFAALPNLNIDYGVLEGNENVYVEQAHYGWADIGSWTSLHIDKPADADGNLLLNSQSILLESEGNIIRLPKDHVAVVGGLSNFVIAEEGGVLMICPKDDLQMMRRLRNEAHLKNVVK